MRRLSTATFALLVLILALSGCTSTTSTVLGTPTSEAPVVTDPRLCPAWTNPPAPVAIPAPAQSSTYAIAQHTAQVVLRTPRPIRNLYAITQHLVKHLATPIACLARGSPRNEHVGDTREFYVTNPDQSGYHLIAATLAYVTPHLYDYVEQGAQVDMTGLRASADTFERQSFATDERTYGQHWSPGVDDDPHITVLNANNLGNVGGYFSSGDEYPRAVFPFSNERQMIYVNLDGGEIPGEQSYDATLAHEFQHMIHWYEHPADPSWSNEGMSVLAQHINHFTADGVDQAFLAQPDSMLGGWVDDNNQNIVHYGAGYLFNDYFAEHLGGYSVLRQLLADPAQVPLNYDDVLAAHGTKLTFDEVFARFAIANLLNDSSVAGGIYAYPSIPGEKATPQHTVARYPFADGSASAPASVHQYGTEYYVFQPPNASAGTLTVRFAGNPYVPMIDNQPYAGAANEWWSDTGNDMDATLTRDFDLTRLAGQPVGLDFQAWYDLEPGFDYGYVEVSTDGGQNWTPLKATTSSTTNPNGLNYGFGLTNTSKDCALTHPWQAEHVDLSAYAGKRIALRFETLSDDAVHCQGLALGDIEIPQLGFKDTAASDNGWQAAGFMRTPNLLPDTYLVQAVVYPTGGGAPSVQPVAVNAQTGLGTFTLGSFGAVDHVTLAISAVAPATVVPAQYQLSAQVG